jgi:chaperonin cofactor prefoldin
MTAFPTAALKKEIDGHEIRIQTLEKKDISHDEQLKQLASGLITVNKKADELEERHEALEKVVIESEATLKLVRWMLVVFGGSVIALIWSLITGQASVVFH